MRLVYLGNNRLAWRILDWLYARQERIVGLVLHPAARRKYGPEMMDVAALSRECVFEAGQLTDRAALDRLKALQPDMALSVLFGHILRPPFIDLFSRGCLNLHPSLLPYNRGAFPNVWSIVDRTPAGVTLHYIDHGIDTGDIIAQRQLEVSPIDTGKSLYEKLEQSAFELFCEQWPLVKAGQSQRLTQVHHAGTVHRVKDVDGIDEIDLDRQYRAGDLIDILRARTFPPYPGAYFRIDGRKVRLSLSLEYDIGPGPDGK